MSLPRTPKHDLAAIADGHESVTDNNSPLIKQLSNAYGAQPLLGRLSNSVKPSLDQTVNAHDIRVPFTAVLDQLGAAERDIVLMYHVEGMTLAGIARIWDVHESVVHEQLAAAKKTLSEMMTPFAQEPDDAPTPEMRALFQSAEPSAEMSVSKFQELALRIARIPLAPATEKPPEEERPGSLEDFLAKSVLTPRQEEIARMLMETSLTCKEIALRLNLREGTLRKHVENIYRQLNVHSRGELVNCWRQNNKIASDEDGISHVRRDTSRVLS